MPQSRHRQIMLGLAFPNTTVKRHYDAVIMMPCRLIILQILMLAANARESLISPCSCVSHGCVPGPMYS
jgi:hypothetical protein